MPGTSDASADIRTLVAGTTKKIAATRKPVKKPVRKVAKKVAKKKPSVRKAAKKRK